MVATAVHAFPRVLCDVLGGSFAGFAESDIDDVRVARELVPRGGEPGLG